MSNKVKAAIIGLGWAGCEHLKGYAENPLSDVVAVCDMDQERANQVAQENNVPRTFTDHRQLLEQEDIDVVSIGLPNFLHAPVTIDALNAGKHVLCEKPPARNAEEAIAMAKAAEKNGKTLMYALVLRFAGDAQTLRKMVDDGELGQVYFGKAGYVRRRGIPIGAGGWFVDKSRSGGGGLIDIGVHALDRCWWLMGAPKPVSVLGATFSHFRHLVPEEIKYDVDDSAFAQIRFKNGATLMLEATWALNLPGGGYIQIAGTKAGGKIDPLTIYKDDQDLTPEVTRDNPYRAEVNHFIDCVLNGKTPISSAEQGVTLMKMLDAIYTSSDKMGEVRIT
ncbi:hypothetical protein CMK14_10030 [Candidatus Poribacteria bacterium]|nr:hypothetical protein [Candidatus Poribacteria bacterium]